MKNLLTILSVFTLCSCVSLALKSIGANDKKAQLKELHFDGNNVLFLPMHHIGTKEFYDDVKKKADSLHSEGFTFLYEGISESPKSLNKGRTKTLWSEI